MNKEESKEINIKENKEKDIKVGSEEGWKIKWDAQKVNFSKAAEGGEGELEVQYKKKGDTDWSDKKKIKVKYVKGFWSHGAKIDKDTELESGKKIEAEISCGVKGFKTQGVVTMVLLAVLAVAILVGLWYWMTRKGPEDEE